MSEFKQLLKHFDSPQIVEAACRQQWGQSRHFACIAMIKDAVKRGFLEVLDPDGEVVDSVKTYSRDMMLTDAGREFCGLPKVARTVEKKPKPQATLFD